MSSKEFDRNRPSEKGRDNDPNVKDYSAIRPGVDTISSSETDKANNELTETAKEDFREGEDNNKNADKRFDEIDRD